MESEEDTFSNVQYPVDVQIKEEDDDSFNTMDFLELATGNIQTSRDPMTFDSTDAMENPKNGLMVCLHCLEEVENTNLYDHMVTNHGYRRIFFRCQICQSIFKDRELLLIHKEDCKPPVKRRIRKSINQLLKEVDTIIAADVFKTGTCPVCNVEYPKEDLKQHLLSAHNTTKVEQSLTCDICNRTFKSKLTVREHIKLVHNSVENSEECDLCGQKFGSYKYLTNHKRNVHPSGDKEYRCERCGKLYKSRLCLHQHIKYVHPPESASVECPMCPKIFKSKINLQQHLKVSHGVKKESIALLPPFAKVTENSTSLLPHSATVAENKRDVNDKMVQ